MLVELDRLLQGLEDLLSHMGDGVGVLHIGQPDGELVAAEAGDGVLFTYAPFEPVGNGRQKDIAGVMPQGVVDTLELVEVEEQQGQGGTLTATAGKGDRKSTRLNSSHVKISYAV